ncbi:MAG: hypothetical protein U9P49_03175 [Thermodesulfobacteriota bacterium]|nr:hypothetical protein [Thermodesulfobacteriota bacterium]
MMRRRLRNFIEQLSHVPIIDPNPRRGEKIPMEPIQEGPICPKKLCGTGEFVFER